MKKVLVVTGSQTGKLILRLTAEGEHVSLDLASSSEVREEILSMLRDGLVEWSTEDRDTTQRITPASDPTFLDRLAGVLQREFSFLTRIETLETRPEQASLAPAAQGAPRQLRAVPAAAERFAYVDDEPRSQQPVRHPLQEAACI